MYFFGEFDTNNKIAEAGSSGTYDKGDRIVAPFQAGILSNAMEWAYQSLPASDTARRDELKRRMVKMAQFVYDNGLDPTYKYTASSFGIVNGKLWHSYSASCGSGCTFWDSAYTTSLVNTLVRGYKLTGDRKYYDKAREFFNRGSKGIYGNPNTRTAPDSEVAHFVDTQFASGTDFFFLDFNRGELFYTYMLFENGGL
jgi:hypothetical protein